MKTNTIYQTNVSTVEKFKVNVYLQLVTKNQVVIIESQAIPQAFSSLPKSINCKHWWLFSVHGMYFLHTFHSVFFAFLNVLFAMELLFAWPFLSSSRIVKLFTQYVIEVTIRNHCLQSDCLQ